MSILRAIRKKCLSCCANSPKEVRLCGIEDCPLHSFRFGRNPKRAGIGGRLPKGQIPPGLKKYIDSRRDSLINPPD